MNHRKLAGTCTVAALTLWLGGCPPPQFDFEVRNTPRVWVRHSPINPEPGETIRFTATAELGGAALGEIRIHALLPAGSTDHTCLAANPCELTVTVHEAAVVLYSARVETAGGDEASSPGAYAFHVGQPAAPQPVALRVPFDLLRGDQTGDVLLVADRDDYPGGALDLRADAEALLYDGLLSDPAYRWRDDQLGFWLSRFTGTTSDYDSGLATRCGQEPWSGSAASGAAATAAAFADVLAVIHRSGYRDCAGLGVVMSGAGTKRNFSADGDRPDVFQHELGHAFAGLSDEYREDTADRTARGSTVPPGLACECCDEGGGVLNEDPTTFCPPGLPSCIGFVRPPECDPVPERCPPLGSSCEAPNIFPDLESCQSAATAIQAHPGVENPQPPADCRLLCSNTTPDAESCPCTTAPIEWWILDRRHPLKPELLDDVMGVLDRAAPPEQHGPACVRCIESRFCIEWELARGESRDAAEAHCLDPQEESR